MRRSIVFGTLLVLLIGGFAAAWYWSDDDWGPPDGHRIEIVRVSDSGTPIAGDDGETIIVERDGDRGWFFFPFGLLLFPLFFFLVFGLLGRLFWGNRSGGGGPAYRGGNGDGPPPWFEEWHRRQHERDRDGRDRHTGSDPVS